MIGRLKGRVDGRGDNWALIDVGGVGYMVEGSARMLDALPSDGEAVSLAIETYVREDQLRLFGFLSEQERSWFRLLMGVQGVGARVALAHRLGRCRLRRSGLRGPAPDVRGRAGAVRRWPRGHDRGHRT